MEPARVHRANTGWSWDLNPGLTPQPELVTPHNEAMNYIRPPLCLFYLYASFGINTMNLPQGTSPKPPRVHTLLPPSLPEVYCPSPTGNRIQSRLNGSVYHSPCQREGVFCFVVTPIYLQRNGKLQFINICSGPGAVLAPLIIRCHGKKNHFSLILLFTFHILCCFPNYTVSSMRARTLP